MNISKISPQEAINIIVGWLKADHDYWNDPQNIENSKEQSSSPGYAKAVEEADALLKKAGIDFRTLDEVNPNLIQDNRLESISELYESMKDTLNNFSGLITQTQQSENQKEYFNLFESLRFLRDAAADHCTSVRWAAPVNHNLSEDEKERLAWSLYEKYCIGVGGKAFNGDTLPPAVEFFADISKKKQADAWRHSAAAAATFFETLKK